MSLDPGLFKNEAFKGFINLEGIFGMVATNRVNLGQVCSWNSEQSRLLQLKIGRKGQNISIWDRWVGGVLCKGPK